MSKRQLLMVLGIWVMALFSLGFPGYLKQILAVATGAVIVIVAYRIRPEMNPRTGGSSALPYVEHRSGQPQPPETAADLG